MYKWELWHSDNFRYVFLSSEKPTIICRVLPIHVYHQSMSVAVYVGQLDIV